MTAEQELILWGATGQAKVLNELIQGDRWRLVALVDNRKIPSPLEGIPVLLGENGLDQWLLGREKSQSQLYGALAVGGWRGADRLRLMKLFEMRDIAIATLTHRTAFIATDAVVGVGCQVLAHASICTHATLGRGVIVNTAASVDHDCILHDGVHIAPGARLAGEVIVEEAGFVGVGASILPGIRIGVGAIVGAGSVVLHDVPDFSVAAGNPARIIEKNNALR